MDKNTCKKLDRILETLNKQITRGLDVLKFCKENFEFENINHEKKLEAVQEFRILISKLIDTKKAEYITERNKDYLRITDAGRVFSGYCKQRTNEIKLRWIKRIKWGGVVVAILAGIFVIIQAIINIWNLCKCCL